MATDWYKLVPKDPLKNAIFRLEMRQQALKNPAMQREIWQACANDVLFFINTFGVTHDTRKRRSGQRMVPFVTFPFQDNAILRMQENMGRRDMLIEKSRDMGATWITLALIDHFWQFVPDLMFLVASRNAKLVDDTTNPKSIFWKLDLLRNNRPDWLRPKFRRSPFKLANLSNGSTIDGESTTGDLARGDRRFAIFIDEFAAFEFKDGYNALGATLHATDCRIFNSTYKGAVGAFYESKLRMERTGEGEVLTFHWSSRPDQAAGLYASNAGKLILIDVKHWEAELKQKFTGRPVKYRCRFGEWDGIELEGLPGGYPWVLESKRSLRSPYYDRQCRRHRSDRTIAEELDIDPQGAGAAFFKAELIAEHRHQYVRQPVKSGEFHVVDREAGAEWKFRQDAPVKPLQIWCDLDHEGNPPHSVYVMGCDIAVGTGASNTCFSIGDKRTGEKVAEWTSAHTGDYDAAIIAVALCRWFHNALIIWENNGCGISFGKKVIRMGYGNIYYKRDEKNITNKQTKSPGWHPTQGKELLLGQYEEALSEGKFINRSAAALDECLQFFYQEDGRVYHAAEIDTEDPSGAKANHGDRVIADALCYRGLGEVAPPKAETAAAAHPGRSLRARIAYQAEQSRRQSSGITWGPHYANR